MVIAVRLVTPRHSRLALPLTRTRRFGLPPHRPMTACLSDRILDAALGRSAYVGWDALHLHQLADDVGIGLVELARHYPDKHSLGQALFDRADQKLLECAGCPGWRAKPTGERLALSLSAWFEVLTPHRAQVRQILGYQLQPEHLHLQVQGTLRISHTVQCWREASGLRAVGARREALEAGLTAIYLATVARWLADRSQGGANTRRWLAWQLQLWRWAGLALEGS